MSKEMREFVEYWKNRGSEKSDAQSYWLSLLRALEIQKPETFIQFERPIRNGKSKIFIDAYIPETKVLIEMKSSTVDLDESIMQSDGTKLTPFEQACKYIVHLPMSEHPKYVVTCNFKEMRVYDMENPESEPHIIYLSDFNTQISRLKFLIKENDVHIERQERVSKEAVKLISVLYDALEKQYTSIDEKTARSLNILCVRLVFCLFADDSGLFKKDQFIDFIRDSNVGVIRDKLIKVFKILDTPESERDAYDNSGVNLFPYVNGGLFKEEVTIPSININIMNTLNTVAKFDWSQISPTIFGSIFESTLSAKRRHENGMHYTSTKNIHKVIDKLFLDDFKAEFDKIKNIEDDRKRVLELRKFQIKLHSYKFLDPACGSGNFLTETYLCLREIENDVIELIMRTDPTVYKDNESPIKVNIGQFYGIEIDDFAVSVARTALWIAEAQAFKTTQDIGFDINFFPLKSNNNIVEANALRIDWEQVVGGVDNLDYIIGNPPFLGAARKSTQQSNEINDVFKESDWVNKGYYDYVLCWFKKAVDMMLKNNKIKAALVATNSICQGEPVGTFWKKMIDMGVHINFAYKSFGWSNGADDEAAVSVVIVGFALKDVEYKCIVDSNGFPKEVQNINPYLIEADNIVVVRNNVPLCNVPRLRKGSMPQDGGYLSKISTKEKDAIIKQYPQTKKWFRRLIGADEFLKGKERWCLWLVDVDLAEIREVPPIYERVMGCREFRIAQNSAEASKNIDVPHLFARNAQPTDDYLVIPMTSSLSRDYIPIGYMSTDYVTTNAVQMLCDKSKYLFALLNADIHNFWIKLVCGRLGNAGAFYSSNIVYNNFPFITPTPEEEQKLTELADNILQARANHPNSSLADLYDTDKMPDDLREAHKANDEYVRGLYGLNADSTKEEVLSKLLTFYKYLVDNKVPDKVVKVGKVEFDRDDLDNPRSMSVHILEKANEECSKRTDSKILTYISSKLNKYIKHIIETEYTSQKSNKILKEINKAIDVVVGEQKSLEDSYSRFVDAITYFVDGEDNELGVALLKAIDSLDRLFDIHDNVDAAAYLRNILGTEKKYKVYLSTDNDNFEISDIISSTDLNRYQVSAREGHNIYNYIEHLSMQVNLGVSTNTTLYICESADDDNQRIAEKYDVTLVIKETRGNLINFDIFRDNVKEDILFDIVSREEIR